MAEYILNDKSNQKDKPGNNEIPNKDPALTLEQNIKKIDTIVFPGNESPVFVYSLESEKLKGIEKIFKSQGNNISLSGLVSAYSHPIAGYYPKGFFLINSDKITSYLDAKNEDLKNSLIESISIHEVRHKFQYFGLGLSVFGRAYLEDFKSFFTNLNSNDTISSTLKYKEVIKIVNRIFVIQEEDKQKKLDDLEVDAIIIGAFFQQKRLNNEITEENFNDEVKKLIRMQPSDVYFALEKIKSEIKGRIRE